MTLGVQNAIHFPAPHQVSLAVDTSGQNPRVEPLSDLRQPAWDVLVSSGRFNEISADEATNLVQSKWADPILGLAGAYALFAAKRWQLLKVVTENLAHLLPSLDGDLLSIVARNKGVHRVSRANLKSLREAANRGDVPYFRWGVRLALDLLSLAPQSDELSNWQDALSHIHSNLSPFAVWTVWSGKRIANA